ncbi:hypothetical protein V7S43_009926 [Phytophthora oleae]|uniref:RxLR effector protein n=1 Tax=Phytophthora oleae TaxID=2107226 RepID=A0ABD3FEC1_9STRA
MRLSFVLLTIAAAVLTCTDATPVTHGAVASTIESANRLRSEEDGRNLKEKKTAKKTTVSVDDLAKEERTNLLGYALFWTGLSSKPLSRSKPLRTATGAYGIRVISDKEYKAKLARAAEAAAKAAKNDEELALKVKTVMKKLQKSAKAEEAPTDYEVPSVLQPRGNQTHDDTANEVYPKYCGVAAVNDQFIENVLSSQNVSVMDKELEQAQQRWLDHQHDQFDMLLYKTCRQPKDPHRQAQSTSSGGQCERRSVQHQISLQQLDHVQQLLLTAEGSLPRSSNAPDYMVATQCYSMALEQLTAMVKTLERRSAS